MNPDEIQQQADLKINKAQSLKDLDNVETEYLGRNGVINKLLLSLKDSDKEKRKNLGSAINTLKKFIADALSQKRSEISDISSADSIDLSLPIHNNEYGSLHIVTYAIEEIVRIFSTLGFIRQSYREVEWEFFSFESLNMPVGHPARDDFETFFIDSKIHPEYGKMLLTPHTSSGQVREMWRVQKPPIKMINIAKTYRPNWDVSHVPMFHQFEGLCIDTNINITNLKGTIDYFVKQFFGESRETRLRPFHFQFTEPSFEVDITCDICKGTGKIKNEQCRLCKSGWLELGGAGMVHPNVLKSGKIDSAHYSGWAFGFGIERVMMMKEGLKLDDIRVLYSGDIRFLEQF